MKTFTVCLVCLMAVVSAFAVVTGPVRSDGRPPLDVTLALDGKASFVETEAHASHLKIAGNAPRTVEAWIHTREFGKDGAVFSVGSPWSTGTADFSLLVGRDRDRWRLELGVRSGGDAVEFTHPSLERWVHMAVVHTGEQTILYADGEEVARREGALETADDVPFRIGRWAFHIAGPQGRSEYSKSLSAEDPNPTFNGQVSEVRLWNRALDKAEIRSRMNASPQGDEEGLALYWPLDDGWGPTVRDTAGNYPGRILGRIRWVTDRFFERQPDDAVVRPGERLVLGPVRLRDPEGEVKIQWYRDDEPIEGATDKTLELAAVGEEDWGSYYVMVDDELAATPVRSTRRTLVPDGEADWPQYRYDAGRTAATPYSLPANLELQWVRDLGRPRPAFPADRRLWFDRSYEPVVYNGTMYVPSMVTDTVTALDAATGEERWRFFAGGPVRFAPVAWEGKIYFTSDDGFLYCLDAENGALRWRFRGLPEPLPDRKVVGNERVISLWAARGGPVLDAEKERVYFAAGIWPTDGVYVHAVDAVSGEAVWTNDEGHYLERANWDHFIGHDAGLTPQGHLAIVGDYVVVPCGAQLPAFLDRDTGVLHPYTMGWKTSHGGAGGGCVLRPGRGNTSAMRAPCSTPPRSAPAILKVIGRGGG